MPLFAVIGFDHPPHSMELREKLRPQHRAYSQGKGEMTRLAGALYDPEGNQCGTLKIFEADNAQQVWDWYKDEPFFTNGVYKDFHVIEWRLALNQFEPTGWVQNYPGRVEKSEK